MNTSSNLCWKMPAAKVIIEATAGLEPHPVEEHTEGATPADGHDHGPVIRT
ncbi:MAG: hypothetical protein IPJ46_03730 [Anaerolineales bacterium]|nr:hypothetical protein [Anaerolineales bacterium]